MDINPDHIKSLLALEGRPVNGLTLDAGGRLSAERVQKMTDALAGFGGNAASLAAEMGKAFAKMGDSLAAGMPNAGAPPWIKSESKARKHSKL